MSQVAMASTPPEAPRRRARGGVVLEVLKERPSALVGAVTVAVIVIVAVFAGVLAPSGATQRVGGSFCPPSTKHWLGCDAIGVDIVSQLMYGARVSLIVGLAATLVATILGGGVGILAGYFGGVIEVVLMRITDFFLVIPDIPLMVVISALLGPSLTHTIFVIGILLWTGTARVIRSQVKSVRERVYVKRTKSLGASDVRVIFKHVLPQVGPLLVANTVLTIAVAIFDETALAFLGLGDPTKVSWGTMIENAFERAAISVHAWWAILPPGLAVGALCLGLSLWGQAIEDALNPRLKVSHLSARLFRLRRLPAMDA